MPRHRTDNPQEVIDLAASALRLVGGILLLWAVLGTSTLALRLKLVDLSEGADLETLAEFAGTTLPYLLGAICFLVFAYFLRRRQAWAAVAAIVATTIALVISALALCALTFFVVTEYDTLALTIPIVFGAAFVYALAQLAYHLTKTFDAMRRLDRERPGGFEPVVAAALPASVLPASPPPLESTAPPTTIPTPASQEGPHAPATQG